MAFQKHRFDSDVAEEMKKEFDNRYGPTWHCIIGRD
ncbi:dynein light chain 1 cytoplasmic-like protein [Trifolium medium]|uniref:Dynein light chain 1 cytoplasmic-like protein n=1 Tax=Trifolium medium TaxID=97028 RepID=A0A392NSM2_9FABA|nr:dynein light chain 1 cytoplasmic-like protein [Trifolium medium]